MKKTQPIQQYFLNTILRYAGLGLFLLCLTSLGISFLLARAQMGTDLQESAVATAEAFHDRIIDGDIRSVEPQIRQILKISEGESAQILKPDLTRVYNSFALTEIVRPCARIGIACFDGYFGQARIFVPVSLSSSGEGADRYLYLSRKIKLNWSYLATVFIVFALGYMGLTIAFLRVSKLTSAQLGSEITDWADRLKKNPKQAAPIAEPPFTELLPLRQALEGLNSQIEKFEKTATNKARLLLLRGIAHDILTPVARLQRYVGVLEDSIDRTSHADTLDEIQDALNLVTGIASQVKTLNDLDLPVEETDLVTAAAQEAKALRDSKIVGAKSIQLKFSSNVSNFMSPFSRTEISRILSNLVQNAADASSKGGLVEVTIGRDGDSSYLAVTDSGCGIPEEVQSRVFDPDFTLKPGTGTGLGLAIVKYICDCRSAKVELQSKVNSGTTVTIWLPEIGGACV